MSIAITVSHNGTDYPAEVATIESTSLGTEDHGFFTAQVSFSGSGWGQGLPGRALATEKFRDSTGYGIEHVWSIIRTVGCGDWEHLKGSRCLVLRAPQGYGFIVGLADVTGERVIVFEEHHADWFAKYPETVA